jgi:hypothetical protein
MPLVVMPESQSIPTDIVDMARLAKDVWCVAF